MPKHVRRIVWMLCVVTVVSAATTIHGEDWPQYRGARADGLWNETGILETFPAQGLKVLWRAPIKGGYTGPSVADGRVFVTDFMYTKRPNGIERAIALDEKTGQILWTRDWEASYSGMGFDGGPRATPTVDGDRIYVLGSSGILHCLNARTGEVIWRKDYQKDLGAQPDKWSFYFGFSSPPLVDGDRLICLVGGEPNAKVVAFDKRTGKELWRALSTNTEPGFSQPIIISAGGTRQLIVWHVGAVTSLDPATGTVYWEQPFKVDETQAIMTPVFDGSRLLISSFYTGAMMLTLDDKKPEARVLWKSKSTSEILTDGLHALMSTPFILGDYLYGICSFGQMRGLNATTGARLWETQAVTKERARWASALMVRNGDRFFINNDRGELIIARFAPDGYHEISRTQLIKATSRAPNRRELGAVNWTHPAYANRHLYTRNDEELIAITLAVGDYK
jgi:outer membrane protein assembly factor BamB